MAAAPDVVVGGTADCVSDCCLPTDCRCGSNYRSGCPKPDPPLLSGRAMPAVLYAQVTGYDTLQVYQSCFGLPPPQFQVGGCWAYLSQLENWPVRKTASGYRSDYATFVNTDPRFGPVDCTFLGYVHRDDPVPTGVSHVVFDFDCIDELRCTFAGQVATVLPSCGATSSGPPNCGSYSSSGTVPLANVIDTIAGAGNWYRSGVAECDPFWGVIELFDVLASGYLTGGEPTCDQTGHPDPPCCADGPCGLLSDPPEVRAYREISPFGVPCNDETTDPANRKPAELAVRVDLFETPV